MLVLEVGNAVTQNSGSIIEFVQGNWGMLIAAIVFIIAAILILAFLKQIIVNSILGIIAWALLLFVFQVKLNFWASLIVSIIFGIGGIGVLLVLKFFGIPV